MGKNMKAGKRPKSEKNIRRLEKVMDEYALQAEKEITDRARENLKDEVANEIMYRHNIDMISVMLALKDEFRFGKVRIVRVLRRATSHAERMLLDRAEVDEMLRILEEETGIQENELVWEDTNADID